jgi:hypothetical protein
MDVSRARLWWARTQRIALLGIFGHPWGFFNTRPRSGPGRHEQRAGSDAGIDLLCRQAEGGTLTVEPEALRM